MGIGGMSGRFHVSPELGGKSADFHDQQRLGVAEFERGTG